MQVAALGGIGTTGLSVGATNGGTSVGGTAAASTGASLSGVAGSGAGRVSMLVQLLDGFTTAEILMALMLAAALNKNDRSDDSSALGLLVGLAVANQLQHSVGPALHFNISFPTDPTSAISPTSGLTLNLWA